MKTKNIFLHSRCVAAVLASAFALSVACARKPDDTKIASEIQNKFGQDSGLSSKQLSVKSSDGVVTISGSVDNDAQREAAARQAASTAGVKEVVNNLQVGTAANTPQPAATPDNSSPQQAENLKPDAGRKPHKSRWMATEDNSMVGPSPNNTSGADQNAMAGNSMASDTTTPPPPTNTAPPPPPPPAPPRKLIIDQGTQITVRLVDAIDSEKNQTGDTFHATLNAPLTSDGEEALPAGTDISGHLVDVKSAGKFAGQSDVVLQLDSIAAPGGKTYSLQTDQYKKTGSSRGKNTAEKVGGGAVLGGIIGALAGGGKGAAIGAAAGAGVGGGVQAATKSQQIKLPSETVLNFTLQAPITVIKASDPNADRQKLGNSQ